MTRSLERLAAALPLRASVLVLVVVFPLIFAGLLARTEMRAADGMAEREGIASVSEVLDRTRRRLVLFAQRGDDEQIAEELPSLAADPALRVAFVAESNARILAASRPALLGKSAVDVAVTQGVSTSLVRQMMSSLGDHVQVAEDGENVLGVSPFSLAGRPTRLVVVRSLAQAKKVAVSRVRRQMAELLAVFAPVAASLWLWLHAALTRRARRLVEAADRFAADDFAARAQLDGKDELAAVGRAFDDMADRVANASLRVRESEERVRLLLDSTAEAICGLDLEGQVTFCNPAALRLLGLSQPEELLGHSLYARARLPGAQDPLPGIWADAAVRTYARVEQELHIVRDDGSVVPVQHSAGPVLRQGKLVGRVVTLLDLTDKKRAEEALRRSQAQLRIADRLATVGTLSAGVAHEINNPLAYTIANLGFVAEALAKPLGPEELAELRTAMDEALEGADRVRRIVKDMKTLSRVDDERMGAVDVEAALEASVNMAVHELRQRARVVKDFKPIPRARANEGRLVQVFLNLLVNAAQAIPTNSPDKNEVRVSTRVDAQGNICAEICDTGTGIPDDVLPRIFDPFFTTKPVGVGTGLGLSICHSLIASVGGQIDVWSKVGVGTRFTVTLQPAVTESARPAA
jgi:two-component system, NtrC family, sensor kinase